MPVNSGSDGTTISFSDLQTAYGGSHPISLSEYYRGGTEVPNTRTILAAGSSNGGDVGETGVTRDGILVQVDDIPGSTMTTYGNLSRSNPPRGGYRINDLSTTSFWYGFGVGRGNLTISHYPQPNLGGHPTQIFGFSQDDNTGQAIYIRGGAFRSGDRSGSPFRTVTTGSLSIGGDWTNQEHGTRTVMTTTTPTTYNISMRNNTGQTVNFTSSPTGNDASFTNGETRSVTGQSNPNWSFSYPAVTASDANNEIPTSGTITLDGFNTPGNFTS